jgi:hypothetical protein
MTTPGGFNPGDVLTATDMNLLPAGRVASITKVANQAGFGGSPADISGLSVTITALSGRKYKITGQTTVSQGASAANAVLYLLANGSQIAIASTQVVATYGRTVTVIAEHTPGAGSVTYKLQCACDAGTVNVSAATSAPSLLLVEDIGV